MTYVQYAISVKNNALLEDILSNRLSDFIEARDQVSHSSAHTYTA